MGLFGHTLAARPGDEFTTPEASGMFDQVWYPGGPLFQALGVSDGSTADTLPDEKVANVGPGVNPDLTMSTSSRRPIYRSSVAAFNNKPTLEFDGSNDMMQHAGPYTAGGVALPYTVIVIGKYDTLTAFTYMTDALGSTRMIIGLGASTATWRMYAGSDTTGGTTSTNATALRAYFTSGNDVLTANGSTAISGANATGANFSGFTIGADYSGGANLDGHIAFAATAAGDATAHAHWSGFVTWVSTYYGLTIS